MAHPNEDLLRTGYGAFARGDMETIDEIMTDDVVWHFPGTNKLAGEFKGKTEVMGWIVRSMELSGGTVRVEPHDILANDEHGVALIRVTASHAGTLLDDETVQVFHFTSAKISEPWFYPQDQATADSFWS